MSATLRVNYAVLAKIASTFDLPEYVKNAEAESLLPTDVSNLDAYASIRPQPSLPIHTKAACWLSNMEYAIDQGNKPNPEFVAARLAKAAAYFGISQDLLQSLNKHKEGLEKSASSKEKYPVRNRQEALAAEQYLLKFAGTDEISDLETCMLAANIYSALGMQADPRIQKMAGHGGVSIINEFAQAVGGRASFSGVIESQDLSDINKNLFEIIKTAALLKTVDRPWEAIQHDSPMVKLADSYYEESKLYGISKQAMKAICGSAPFYECDRIPLLMRKSASFSEAQWYLLKDAVGEPAYRAKDVQPLPLVAALLKNEDVVDEAGVGSDL